MITVFILSFLFLGLKNRKNYSNEMSASVNPPRNLDKKNVPFFVCFTFDDNGYGGLKKKDGLTWATNYFSSRKNPPGTGKVKTYDNQPLHYSFYITSMYLLESKSKYAVDNKIAWRNAYKKGNEIGIHTHTHPHGRKYSEEQWEDEIKTCIDLITKKFDVNETNSGYNKSSGVGIPKYDIHGFRTSFLEYNNNVFKVMKKIGFLYDSSLQEGFQLEHDGTNYFWPYTLDEGSPGNRTMNKINPGDELLKSYPGLWEAPIYAVIVPPDNECKKYDVKPGLRKKLKESVSYFNIESGKITGLDWNMWYEFKMNKKEFIATLKYTIDLRLSGNRSPFIFGAHSDYYADDFYEKAPNATPIERRQSVEEVIDYALTKSPTRVVSVKEMIDWIKNPELLK